MAGLGTTEDGHPTLGGALWHTPAKGEPWRCQVAGCEKELTGYLPPADDPDEEADDDS